MAGTTESGATRVGRPLLTAKAIDEADREDTAVRRGGDASGRRQGEDFSLKGLLVPSSNWPPLLHPSGLSVPRTKRQKH